MSIQNNLADQRKASAQRVLAITNPFDVLFRGYPIIQEAGGWFAGNIIYFATAGGVIRIKDNPTLKNWYPNIAGTMLDGYGLETCTIDLSGNGLTVADLDNLLANCQGSSGTNCTLNLTGGTNAAPEGYGLVVIDELRNSLSWSVTTNPIHSLVVSGAGSSAANGAYEFNGIANDRPRYAKLDSAHTVQWNGSQWIIFDDENTTMYFSNSDTMSPWNATNWEDGDADVPSPSITVLNKASMVVSGAGTAAANGTYTFTGIINGRPFYNKAGSDVDQNSISYAGNGLWVIYVDGGDQAYGAFGSGSEIYPHELNGSYGSIGGNEPAPSVIQGSV